MQLEAASILRAMITFILKQKHEQTNRMARELFNKIQLLRSSFLSRRLDKGSINSKLSKSNRKVNMGNEGWHVAVTWWRLQGASRTTGHHLRETCAGRCGRI